MYRANSNIPNISPHAQEIFLQKCLDLAPAGDFIAVRKIAAIVALQNGSLCARQRFAMYLFCNIFISNHVYYNCL